MLGYRFGFEAYAKTKAKEAAKRSLKTTEVLLDAEGHALT